MLRIASSLTFILRLQLLPPPRTTVFYCEMARAIAKRSASSTTSARSPTSKRPRPLASKAEAEENALHDAGDDTLSAGAEASSTQRAQLRAGERTARTGTTVKATRDSRLDKGKGRQTQLSFVSAKKTSEPDPASGIGSEDDLLALERRTMDRAWFERLEAEMNQEYFRKLQAFLKAERAAKKTIYPPEDLVHSWSRETPLDKVKVVVLGQDPYHGPGQACGHSFSVPRGVAVPGSLKNIYKELAAEYAGGFTPAKHGDLTGWARQGVLLLNACLTVQAGQAGSHHGKGWEPFTRAVIKLVADQAAKGAGRGGAAATANSQLVAMFNKAAGHSVVQSGTNDGSGKSSPSGSKGVVFLVWGQPAAKSLAEAGITDKSPNVLVLRSPHPSPLSAHRGFLGNGHFKRANEWLEQRYGPGGGIDWTNF